MQIKLTILGLLIYLSMASYILAFFLYLMKRPKTANISGLIAWLMALSAVIYRWSTSGHLPMQNLFEVFLCLGAFVYPLSWFSWHILKVGGRPYDMLLGSLVLFPAGFIFSAAPQQLPPALQSPLFGPHVTVYMLSYIFLAKAFVQSCKLYAGTSTPPQLNDPEKASYIMVCAGFPLLTAGLMLGSVWAQLTWGDWWGWDPKEMWSLATWLIFAGYLHWRTLHSRKFPRVNAAWIIFGFTLIVITLLWVNLSRLFAGLHNYANG